MPALRPYPVAQLGGVRPPVREYTLKAAQTFKRGDLVTIDSNEDVLEVSGNDPTSLLGFAAEDAAGVVRSGYVLVWVFTDDSVFAMSGSSAPTADHVNQSYGVVETDGVYTLDLTDTTNPRFYVVGIDEQNGLFHVLPIPSYRVILPDIDTT